jgi:molecular chaperone DnaJ
LIIVIEEIEHLELKRESENVHYTAIVSFADAALGASLEIPTLSGKAKIKIDAGTQSGKVLRLRGKGLPNIQGYGQGDQLVHVHVWTPTKLSKEEKEWIEKNRESESFKPRESEKDAGFFKRMRDMFS